jgi:hypothetical protein
LSEAIADRFGPRDTPKGHVVKIASKPLAALAVIATATLSTVDVSHAGGNGVAAGLIGGFAAGAIVGTALAAPRPYYAPAPVYVAPPPPPAYAPACYWTRGEPVWNGVAWVRPRVQVCD